MTAKRRDLQKLDEAVRLAVNAVKVLKDYQQARHSAFGEWVRHQPELSSGSPGYLSVIDGDWIVHQYRDVDDSNGSRRINNLMLVEEKTNGVRPTFAQKDTLEALNALLWNGQDRREKARKVRTKSERGDVVCVRYFGMHYLAFSGAGPEDSETIHWDGHVVTVTTLKEVLTFQRSPFTFRSRTERRHHRNKKQQTFFGLADNQET